MTSSSRASQPTITIIGAGAAGLAAAIFAAENGTAGQRILLLDGARKPGAKILVSGGGRCNVTNQRVTPEDFWGGSRKIIRNVLRAFDERRTLEWMADLGVQLQLEPTGKYFPTSGKARTVLDALMNRAQELGVEFRWPARVKDLRPREGGFTILLDEGEEILTQRVIVATGGLALPKSGSDGAGLSMMKRLGHAIVPTTPALVPLLLDNDGGPGGQFAELSGLTLPARLRLLGPGGKHLAERTDSLLFTHFGISGPAALNISRHWLRHRLEHPDAPAALAFGHPDFASEEAARAWIHEHEKANPRQQPATAITGALFPERLARALAGDFPAFAGLTRPQRGELARRLAALPLAVRSDRGYSFAETTAGGVALSEIDFRTMESRRVPGLYLCGEILDVDGRIGGFNFQWAWASGYVAGRAAAAAGGG